MPQLTVQYLFINFKHISSLSLNQNFGHHVFAYILKANSEAPDQTAS